MPYIKKEFKAIKGKKIEEFLLENIPYDFKLLLSLLAKGKIYDENNNRFQKKQSINSKFIYIVLFEAKSKGLKAIFDSFHFAIFDKPSGLMVHPSSHQLNKYTLLDEIKYYYGNDASLVHRIDTETSGLILVSKNPFSDMLLRKMFEDRIVIKKYKAIVEGKIEKDLIINTPITNDTGLIKLKMKTSSEGKESKTIIKPLYYNEENNQTLIQAIPLTGRQHQIRVHLNSINHRILGDPIYGINEENSNIFLNNNIDIEARKEITGASRLMLQADYLEFKFLNNIFIFNSIQKL